MTRKTLGADRLTKSLKNASVSQARKKLRSEVEGGKFARGRILPCNYSELRAIVWSHYLGKRHINLQGVLANFYVLNAVRESPLSTPEIKKEIDAFNQHWAEVFAKYILAASLGEYRYRAENTGVHLVPRINFDDSWDDEPSREKCQDAARHLWPKGLVTVARVAAILAQDFGSRLLFLEGAYGGHSWAEIARALFAWASGTMSSIVFLDHIWDIVHNNNQLFDKCDLMVGEEAARHLCDVRADEGIRALLVNADSHARALWKEYCFPMGGHR